MKYYFIDDENGTIFFGGQNTTLSDTVGEEAMAFFQTPRGKGTRFMEQSLDGNDDVYFVEVPKDQEDDFRRDERREQYNRDTRTESGYTHISFEGVTGDSGDETGEEMLMDESIDLEAELMREADIELLQKALGLLSQEEYCFVQRLFLSTVHQTESEIAREMGITQQAVNKRKTVVLKKLKYFFELGL